MRGRAHGDLARTQLFECRLQIVANALLPEAAPSGVELLTNPFGAPQLVCDVLIERLLRLNRNLSFTFAVAADAVDGHGRVLMGAKLVLQSHQMLDQAPAWTAGEVA